MSFLLDKLTRSPIGNTIAHEVYRKMIRKGKLAKELGRSSPRLKDDSVSFYLMTTTMKWLFVSGAGLRRVFWAVVIGLFLGWLIGAPSMPLIGANTFGISAWYTAAASLRLGKILDQAEKAAQTNIEHGFDE